MVENSKFFEPETKWKKFAKRKYVPREKRIFVVVILAIYLVMALLTFPWGQETGKSDARSGIIKSKAIGKYFLNSRAYTVYTVKSNDTLGLIANYFRVPLSSIKNENKALAANPRELKIGDQVKINLRKVR